MKTRDEFLSKTREGPGGCIFWTGGRNSDGYGCINWLGKSSMAHRVSYAIFKGEITPGCVVMHSCDNPPCVNPLHLSLGTSSENALDCVRKGRHGGGGVGWPKRDMRGELHPGAKLSNNDVVLILSALESKNSTKIDIANRFGISRRLVRMIETGKSWPHINRP